MGRFSGAQTGEDLEKRIARLEDVEAITNLFTQYAHYCDDGYDAKGMGTLFVEDAVWESNAFGVYKSRDEFKQFISDIGKSLVWALHYMIAPEIDVAVNGQSATGRFYLLELGTMTGVKDPNSRDAVIITANYDNTFVKVDGEWKIKSVKVHFHQVSNLDLGWVKQPFRGE